MHEPVGYTLAELPKLLVPGADEAEAYRIARKVQNWVTFGLALPVGNPHGGRGVHRRYDDHQVAKLRVLLELTRYELPTTVLERAAGLFDEMREGGLQSDLRLEPQGPRNVNKTLERMRRLWKQVRSGERAVFLLMVPGQADAWNVTLIEMPTYPKGSASAVLVDVGRALSGRAR